MQSCRCSWLRAHIHTSPVAAQEALDNPICSPAISEDGTRRVRRGSRPQHQIEEHIDTSISISSQPERASERHVCVVSSRLGAFFRRYLAFPSCLPSLNRCTPPPSHSFSSLVVLEPRPDSDRGASWTREQVIYLEETFTSSLLPPFLPSFLPRTLAHPSQPRVRWYVLRCLPDPSH